LGEDAGGVNVVSTVNDVCAHGLETSRPLHLTQATGDDVGFQLEASGMQGGDGHGGVPALMRAGEAGFRRTGCVDDRQGSASFFSGAGDDIERFGGLRHRDHGHVGLDDARFFSGDLGEGVAEHVHVVPADGGDDAHSRGDGIGGVQTTTKTCFQHNARIATLGEPFEREGEREFKKCRVRVPTGHAFAQAVDACGDLSRRDHALSVTNALAEVNEVWRGE
jgi:hypothetical protein